MDKEHSPSVNHDLWLLCNKMLNTAKRLYGVTERPATENPYFKSERG